MNLVTKGFWFSKFWLTGSSGSGHNQFSCHMICSIRYPPLWNHYRVNFAIKIGDLYNLPFNKVIHINQFCYGHFLLYKFPSHMSNLLQLFPLWIFKSPLGSEYIILISIYDTHTHFGSKWWWLHNLNTAQPWYIVLVSFEAIFQYGLNGNIDYVI